MSEYNVISVTLWKLCSVLFKNAIICIQFSYLANYNKQSENFQSENYVGSKENVVGQQIFLKLAPYDIINSLNCSDMVCNVNRRTRFAILLNLMECPANISPQKGDFRTFLTVWSIGDNLLPLCYHLIPLQSHLVPF